MPGRKAEVKWGLNNCNVGERQDKRIKKTRFFAAERLPVLFWRAGAGVSGASDGVALESPRHLLQHRAAAGRRHCGQSIAHMFASIRRHCCGAGPERRRMGRYIWWGIKDLCQTTRFLSEFNLKVKQCFKNCITFVIYLTQK